MCRIIWQSLLLDKFFCLTVNRRSASKVAAKCSKWQVSRILAKLLQQFFWFCPWSLLTICRIIWQSLLLDKIFCLTVNRRSALKIAAKCSIWQVSCILAKLLQQFFWFCTWSLVTICRIIWQSLLLDKFFFDCK